MSTGLGAPWAARLRAASSPEADPDRPKSWAISSWPIFSSTVSEARMPGTGSGRSGTPSADGVTRAGAA